MTQTIDNNIVKVAVEDFIRNNPALVIAWIAKYLENNKTSSENIGYRQVIETTLYRAVPVEVIAERILPVFKEAEKIVEVEVPVERIVQSVNKKKTSLHKMNVFHKKFDIEEIRKKLYRQSLN